MWTDEQIEIHSKHVDRIIETRGVTRLRGLALDGPRNGEYLTTIEAIEAKHYVPSEGFPDEFCWEWVEASDDGPLTAATARADLWEVGLIA